MPEFQRHSLFCATWTRFRPMYKDSPLPHTGRSARAISEELGNAGVLADDPTMLEDQDSITTLNTLEDFLETSADSVIVYLASHGMFPTVQQDAYRLATGETKWSSDGLRRSLPISEVVDLLDAADTKQAILLVDACYSGWSAEELMGDTQQIDDAPLTRPGLCVIASSSPYDASIAPLGADFTLFAQLLLDAFRRDRGGAGLTASELYDELVARSATAQGPRPHFVGQGDTHRALILPSRGMVREPEPAVAKDVFDNRAEILYVDDDDEALAEFAEALEAEGHHVATVGSPPEAYARLSTEHYDIVVLDLFITGDQPSTDLIQYVGDRFSDAKIMIASGEGKATDAWKHLDAVFSYPNTIDAFTFKADHIDQAIVFANGIRDRRTAILERVDGIDQMAPLVAGRILRRGAPGSELGATTLTHHTRICVEKLTERWFAPDSNATDYVESLQMEPLGTGRSSCAVFSLTPVIKGLSAAHVSPLILKLGPSEEIAQEAVRFNKFVQVGVPMSVRTDKVAHVVVGAVGGVIYSLIGGDQREILEASTLSTEEIERCLNKILNPKGKRWYGSDKVGDGVRPIKFFGEKKWDRPRFIETAAGLQVGLENAGVEKPLVIDPFFPGRPGADGRQPSTLVHGDMHLGNILKYDVDHFALIDYRNVGIGPRCADFVTLEVDCWLLAQPDLEVDRKVLIRELYRAAAGGLDDQRSEEQIPEWLRGSWRLAVTCRRLARENFDGLTPAEYGALLWFTAVRRAEMRLTATSKQEKLALKTVPHAVVLAAQQMFAAT